MLNDFKGGCPVYLACGYTDLRRGIDGMAGLVQTQFQLNPFQNALFLFCGRRKDRIKGLYWEGDRFVLLYKRLESGSIQRPRRGGAATHGTAVPVADGGGERGAAESAQDSVWAEHFLMGKSGIFQSFMI